jgi:hypothetical protein
MCAMRTLLEPIINSFFGPQMCDEPHFLWDHIRYFEWRFQNCSRNILQTHQLRTRMCGKNILTLSYSYDRHNRIVLCWQDITKIFRIRIMDFIFFVLLKNESNKKRSYSPHEYFIVSPLLFFIFNYISANKLIEIIDFIFINP